MVENPDELVATVDRLLSNLDDARELGTNGLNILTNNRGALKRLLEVIEPLIAAEMD